jgi:hypothetical protein
MATREFSLFAACLITEINAVSTVTCMSVSVDGVWIYRTLTERNYK